MRHAIYASVCVMATQQACRELQSEQRDIALENQKSLEFSLYFSLINFLGTWIAFPMIDSLKWVRRKEMFRICSCRAGYRRLSLIKISFLLMAVLPFIIGGIARLEDNDERKTELFPTFTLFFTARPTAFVVSAEVHALIVRELGMSFAVFVNLFLAAVLSFFVPIMASSMNSWWFWYLFGGFSLIFWRLSLIFVKATEKDPLENITLKYTEKPYSMEIRMRQRPEACSMGDKMRKPSVYKELHP
ncbi:hypothetical protein P280DRAFT_319311 [Massarina eburnea CBS 473.64]|uniref:MFS general substrate transporter n=1 Tax=Massarina eburnea CBS 473.64 TaxID=1395130 RepID=A0A6A6RI97_9PLEO|nr:hypothetical protein P280DRAFT_319311 [Massarina eburnea CBS 473.64]